MFCIICFKKFIKYFSWSFDPKNYIKKKLFFQNNAQFSAYVPHKLSCYKIVVGDYGFTFLKRLETVLTNHNFNFKFKAVVGD